MPSFRTAHPSASPLFQVAFRRETPAPDKRAKRISIAALLLFALCLIPMRPAEAQPFQEQNGLVVIEAESNASPFEERSGDGSTGGQYLQWEGGDRFNNPGQGLTEYEVQIQAPGTYRVQWRNQATGSSNTEENDSWMKVQADAFYGVRGSGVVCPKGYDPSQNDCSGGSPNGAGSNGWFKVYANSTNWSWQTATSDDEPHDLFARFDSPGTYTVQVSGRSNGHAIDRLVLYSDAFSGNATNTSLDESPRAGGGGSTGGDGGSTGGEAEVTGELRRYHPVAVTFEGPSRSENASTFTDYRFNLEVTTPSGQQLTVPGYFAADGDAANSSANSGSKWRAHVLPLETGTYQYEASFRTGSDVAVSLNDNAGTPTAFDGERGSFEIGATNKSGRDHRGKGLLSYNGSHYLHFSNGERFLKGGADSPETFLAYTDFDATCGSGGSACRDFSPHERDWNGGDPTWDGGRGKGVIGALNYLSGEEMNAFSFLTMNAGGDGDNVWPWANEDAHRTYDVSKLAQWEVVFSHADRKGLFMHFKTQETENDGLLGGLGLERKLYYRELVARFAHHHALNWNLGEENRNTPRERRDFASYIRDLDPYDHPITLHTYPQDKEGVYDRLLGFGDFEGPSIQLNNMNDGRAYDFVRKYYQDSEEAGQPWVLSIDEPGNAQDGVYEDGGGNLEAAREVLYAALLAGGDGVEWYFGYNHPEDDIDAEDFRSRSTVWQQTRVALRLFRDLDLDALSPINVNQGYAAQFGDTEVYYLKADASQPFEGEALYVNPRTGEEQTRSSKPGGDWIAIRGGTDGGGDNDGGDGGSGDNDGGGDSGSGDNDGGGDSGSGGGDGGGDSGDGGGDGGGTVNAPSVSGFTLVNADTDEDIAPLSDGDVVDLSATGTANLSVRAGASGAVESVRFGFEGNSDYQTESQRPYALTGDSDGDYYASWDAEPGSYELSATPFAQAGARGEEGQPLSITFTVVENGGSSGGNGDNGSNSGGSGDHEVVFAVNAGGEAFTDPGGQSYQADTGFEGGRTYATSEAISSTGADALYQSERYGSFSYALPLEAGTYEVVFRLAEIYHESSGKRRFDVSLEDEEQVSDLDLFAQAGAHAAYDLTKTVEVSDGALNLAFDTDVDNAKLSALLVRRLGEGGGNGGASCTATEDVSVSAEGLPLRFFGTQVGTRKSATLELSALSAAQSAALTLTADDIDAPAEATLLVNGTEVDVPAGIIEDPGSDSDLLTATAELELSLLEEGENEITLVFASDLDGTTGGYEITDLEVTLAQCASGRSGQAKQTAAKEAALAGRVPETFALEQNYPNPFSRRTSIRFALPEATHVQIAVYDLLGRRVATPVDEQRGAGKHTVRWNAEQAAPGMYVYRIEAGDFSDTRKMVLVK